MKRTQLHQAGLFILLGILLVITFVPVYAMILLSFKTNAEIVQSFWGFPEIFHWEHYRAALSEVARPIANSLFVVVATILGVTLLSSMSGYVFARHEFPFKESLFYLILALLMVPVILTLIPTFLLVKQLHLLDTRWALILPYVSGGQIIGILLCRAFMSQIPNDLFDAARIDGANELRVYWHMVLPLSMPILATVSIMTAFTYYNDFIWPLLVITSKDLQVFNVAVTKIHMQLRAEMGYVVACYVVGTIPLTVIIFAGLRYFIQGITAGAVKA